MKPSLQLKIGQQLTMTPQLQQAIRLLQLSTIDLQQEIQETVESNPMLEVNESDSDQADPDSSFDNDSNNSKNNNSDASDDYNNDAGDQNLTDSDWPDNIPKDLPVDSSWDDVYPNAPSQAQSSAGKDSLDFESTMTVSESIQDHLLWQLNLTPMTDLDRLMAMTIIDSVEQDGYLMTSLENIVQTINDGIEQKGRDEPVALDEAAAVLKRLQQFDPVGVCSRDLSECLFIQLEQLSGVSPWIEKAKEVVSKYLPLLGNHDYVQIMRRTKLKEHELQQVIELVQTLNPKPGDLINNSEPEYIIPDVFVRKHEGRWLVELNPDTMPKVRINPVYSSMVKRADNSSDNTYMRNHLQEARWFIKSLQSRNETLLKVATQIVEIQRGFLEHGDEAMKPLVLHDIAKAVEMHESTISRVTTQKYMHTPRGIFELKYFFSSHVDTDSGMGCSSTAIRAIIKKLVAAEMPKKPLSDSKIANILADQGIQVARRTIAKYRESLSIPPSNERKRLI
jgi:RNA polymerase sigma-54 factor